MSWAALAGLAPVVTDSFKMYYGQKNANRDRKITREQMAMQEKNNRFQRLLALSKSAENDQDRYSGARRLLSLRNAGSNP